MIDLDKAGAWDAKEQLEIAEDMKRFYWIMENGMSITDLGANRIAATREAIDAATGGEG